MGNKEYASKEFVDELYVRKENINLIPRDYITFKDRATGCTYYAYVDNGTWALSCKIVGVEVFALPEKMIYNQGDVFDPAGMVLAVTLENGEVLYINDFANEELVVVMENLFTYENPVTKEQYNFTINGLIIEKFNPD